MQSIAFSINVSFAFSINADICVSFKTTPEISKLITSSSLEYFNPNILLCKKLISNSYKKIRFYTSLLHF